MLRLWNDGWSFLRTEHGTELADIPGREEEFSPVVIPHDWLIGDVRHLYEDGTGWYRKRFMAGNWKYGYSAFDVSVGEYLKEGENEVLVQVWFFSPNSRWYSGAGIYRNVWIQVCGEAYLPMDGTYVSSVWEESSAVIRCGPHYMLEMRRNRQILRISQSDSAGSTSIRRGAFS